MAHFPSLKAAVGWLGAAKWRILVVLGETRAVLSPCVLSPSLTPVANGSVCIGCHALYGLWYFVSCHPVFEEGEEGLLCVTLV